MVSRPEMMLRRCHWNLFLIGSGTWTLLAHFHQVVGGVNLSKWQIAFRFYRHRLPGVCCNARTTRTLSLFCPSWCPLYLNSVPSDWRLTNGQRHRKLFSAATRMILWNGRRATRTAASRLEKLTLHLAGSGALLCLLKGTVWRHQQNHNVCLK